jgi:hypothetical protein
MAAPHFKDGILNLRLIRTFALSLSSRTTELFTANPTNTLQIIMFV